MFEILSLSVRQNIGSRLELLLEIVPATYFFSGKKSYFLYSIKGRLYTLHKLRISSISCYPINSVT